MRIRRFPHRNFFSLSVILVASIAVASCTQTASLTPSYQNQTTNGQESENLPQASFTQFTDLPFPGGSKMNIEETFIVGSGDMWYGQTRIETTNGSNAAFDFYKQQLPEFGWTELASVRAQNSVLTYTRGHRVLAIQISHTQLGHAEILITVSPKDGAATP